MVINKTQVNIVAGEVLTEIEQDKGFATKSLLRNRLEEKSVLIDMGVCHLVSQGLVLVHPLYKDDYLVVRKK